MPVSSVQYGQLPWQYANGLRITNNVTTPDEKIDIAVGSILDSTGTYQIITDEVLTPSITASGLGGLDTGTVAASTVYAVHLVADPVTQQAVGAMFSLSATAPLMPFGYSAFALIGYVTTDGTADILVGYWTAGNSGTRYFSYDAPIIALSAGTQTSYTGVALTTFVPAQIQTPVYMYMLFAANAATNVANLQGYNSTGDAISLIAPVATGTANTTENVTVLAQLNSGAPSIKYKITAGTLSLYVCGYTFYI